MTAHAPPTEPRPRERGGSWPQEARREYTPLSSDPHGLDAEAFLSLGCMEGIYTPVVSTAAGKADVSRRWAQLAPGYVAAAAVALLAILLHYLPVWPFRIPAEDGLAVRHPVSTAMIAIVLGLLIRNCIGLPANTRSGLKHVVKKLIPIAIVVIGAELNLVHLYHSQVGFRAFGVILVCMAFAIVAGYYISRWLGLGSRTALLLGAGTGICGNSAIIAVSPLIDAEDDDVALSVGTVNLVGLLAMLAWPVFGAAIGLSSEMFGVWSGVSIHAVPQVVAAGFAFDGDAGSLATLVKMVRVTLLAPLVFVLAVLYGRRHDKNGGQSVTIHYARLVPWFVWGFVLLALCATAGLLPTLTFDMSSALGGRQVTVSLQELMGVVGSILLTLAMAAIGLEVHLRQLVGVGVRALTAGVAVTLALGGVSLGLIYALL